MIRSIALLAASLLLLGVAQTLCACGKPTRGIAAAPCHESTIGPSGDCCMVFDVKYPAVGSAPVFMATISSAPAPVPLLNLTQRCPIVRPQLPLPTVPLFTLLSNLRI